MVKELWIALPSAGCALRLLAAAEDWDLLENLERLKISDSIKG